MFESTVDLASVDIQTAIVSKMKPGTHGYITLDELQSTDVYVHQHIQPKHRNATKWVIIYQGTPHAVVADVFINTEPTTGYAKIVLIKKQYVPIQSIGTLRSTQKNQYIADVVGAKLIN